MSKRVGFIGLGNQGKPIAAHLAPAGFDTVVYDIDETAMAEVVAGGAPVPLYHKNSSLVDSLKKNSPG